MMGASFAPLVPCTVLLLVALSAVTKASADPLARRIVTSLTEELKQQLKSHDIGEWGSKLPVCLCAGAAVFLFAGAIILVLVVCSCKHNCTCRHRSFAHVC